MDWLILILGVPAILIPLVLLFGFAGCTAQAPVLGEQVSDPSNESLATVFPAAPVNLVATPVSVNQIDLSWTNASATATEFSLERRPPGGAFAEIFRVRDAATTYSDSDPSLVEG